MATDEDVALFWHTLIGCAFLILQFQCIKRGIITSNEYLDLIRKRDVVV